MQRASLILAALFCLSSGAHQAMAGTLVGPTAFGSVGGNDTLWGIQFTALDTSTLTGFDFNHNPTTFGNPFTGTIYVNDLTASTNVFTQNYATLTPNPDVFSGLNITLITGHIYQLVATSSVSPDGANDEVYQYGVLNVPPFSYPVSNSDISVTQGVFNNNPGFQEAFAWGAFNNITTASAVPEPSTLGLLAIGTFSAIGLARRQRRTAVAAN